MHAEFSSLRNIVSIRADQDKSEDTRELPDIIYRRLSSLVEEDLGQNGSYAGPFPTDYNILTLCSV